MKYKDKMGILIVIISAMLSIQAVPASKPLKTGQVLVNVRIIDVNNHVPVFQNNSYIFSVAENKPIGYTVGIVSAVDDDIGAGATLSYQIQPLGPFTIRQQTGAIQVAGALDYDEGIKQYNFLVTVWDQMHSGSVNVTIDILDVNDNAPKVDDYNFLTFKENDYSIVGVIATVNATDIDNDGQNNFYYSLNTTDSLVKDFFSINHITGELSIIQALDRDYPTGKAEFQFVVDVADAIVNPLYGRSTVTVKPIDVNDNAPVFPKDTLRMQIRENIPSGTWVGDVSVVDYDTGVNAECDLRLVSQSPQSDFVLKDSHIRTTTVLDREVVDTYHLILEATDRGTPALTGTATLTISVLDVNDNAPFFNTTYKFGLSERQKSGPIGIVQAYDRDNGQYSYLVYELANHDDRRYFQMRTLTATNAGELVLFSAVDYDDPSQSRNFNLTVNACDFNRENCAQTYIYITVFDFNDEVPIFERSHLSENVLEDVDIGTSVVTVSARDRDVTPAYSSFTYHIEQRSDPLNHFAIDQTGLVTIRNKLDREKTVVHILHILAIDNPDGLPQNTGTATLTVTVTDVNDNYPDFAQPVIISLMENTRYNNTELTQFSAVDSDMPMNGPPFTFQMCCNDSMASDQCDLFELTFDPRGDNGKGKGTIYVTGIFDREKESVIKLPMCMCDSGKPRQCGIRYLNVRVLDENDNKHAAGYQHILVYNYKGLYDNISIGEVNVEDPDAINDDKTYTLITAEASVFVSVASDTGIVTLKPGVPEMTFTFAVDVEDRAGIKARSMVTVTVQYISDDAVYSSGSLRLYGISDDDFVLRGVKNQTKHGSPAYEDSMYEKFCKLLSDKLHTRLENVHILSVMYDPTNGDYTDVRYAATDGSTWFQSSTLDGVVSANKDEFQKLIVSNGTIGMVPMELCQRETCRGGCYNKLIVTDTPRLINTQGTSFVGVTTEVRMMCGCRARDFSSPIECIPGYCYHGGTCIKDNWNVVSCHCPEGFDGPRCQQLRHSFNGTGYALYKPFEQCETSRTSIEILSNKADGLIFYNGPLTELGPADPRDFILLELTGGVPRLRISHGSGELTLTIPGSNPKTLNDGAWHQIDILRHMKEVKLVVDHCDNSVINNGIEDRSNCEAVGMTAGENVYVNVDTVLQVGGRASNPSYPAGVTTERFDGCMKNLMHNAELYDLSTGDVFPGSQDGCTREDDKCGTTPGYCGHGKCLITGPSTHICNCDTGWRTSDSEVCDTETKSRDFEAHSYMTWQLKNTSKILLNKRKTTVSFRFRTRDTEGVLFSLIDEVQNDKFITLKIVGSLLQATYNLGDGPMVLLLSHVPASDGQWHQVRLERYGKELMLKMDSGEGRYYAESLGLHNGTPELNLRQSHKYSGANLNFDAHGQPSRNRAYEQDLKRSCIDDIRLDGYWLPMSYDEETQSPAATIETMINTRLGCVRTDCWHQCIYPFVCVPFWEDYMCTCKSFYMKSGNTCVLKDYCEDSPCVGNATCINLNPCLNNTDECSKQENKKKQYFSCQCSGGWYGNLCQHHSHLYPGVAMYDRYCDYMQEKNCIHTSDLKHVCGTDGKTYNNRCLLGKEYCLNNTVHKAHDGDCQTVSPTPDPIHGSEVVLDIFCTDNANRDCPTGGTPVCATNGVVYSNMCEFDKEKCTNRNIHPNGTCTTTTIIG